MSDRRNNWRLLRIAESICTCLMTDGFCGPQDKPDCRCWIAAQAAVQGLANQSNPCLKEAWPSLGEYEARERLDALVKAIREKSDELTARHQEQTR